MKAVLFDGDGKVKVADVPKPKLQANKDALVKITHSTICGSDLGIVQGKIPLEKGLILGHEGVGVVEEIGSDVKKVKPGDRVVIAYSVQCGECKNCRNRVVVFCENGGMFGHGEKWGGYGGTQAEYLRVPYADTTLEPIPAGVREEQAIFVGDILSTGYQACEYGSIQLGDVVVVFGAGPVGCCAVTAARLFGPSTIVCVDMLDYRLDAAKRLGADIVINAGKTNVVAEIKKMTDGLGAHVAIDATGSPAAFEVCFDSVRPTGKISIVGVFPLEKVGVSIRDMLRRNMQIRAGRANLIHMDRLLSLIQRGKLDPTPLITHHMSLTDAVEAYRLFSSRTGNAMKIILQP